MPEHRGRVLVVGSLNADLTVRAERLPGRGETVTGSDLVVSPGGKSSNQAAAAALLGADVALLGRVGNDGNGDFLVDRLRGAGVDTRQVERLNGVATGTALIAVDDTAENFIIVSPGANGHLTARDIEEAEEFFAGAAVLCLCLEVGLPAVEAAARSATAAGVRVILNPSPFAAVDEDLLRLVDVLVVNQHELRDLMGAQTVGEGDEPDWDRVTQALDRRGPDHVVVTLGREGAVVLGLQGGTTPVHRAPAPRVKAIDTTGCGDAFLGALAHRLALGDDLATACRSAVRVGAFAATRPGAQASYPTPDELERFNSSVDGHDPSVVVVGGANVDIKARSSAPVTHGTSNPGYGSMTPGGVGRNIAENLARLGTRTYLVTAVGRDAAGDDLLAQTSAAGVLLQYVHRTDLPTGIYTALLDSDGELLVAVADMGATAELGPEQVTRAADAIAAADLVIVDGNLAAATLAHALVLAHASGVRAILEPVSVPKATLLAAHITADQPLYAVTPNREELTALTGMPTGTDTELRVAADTLHERGVEHVWVRLGARGSLLSSASADATFIPAVPTTVEDVTGAGDSTLAGFCHALLDGKDPVDAARYGHAAASLTIASPHTVRPDLSPRLVEAILTEPSQEQRT